MSTIRAFLKHQRISTGVFWKPLEYPFSNHIYFLQVYPNKQVYDTSEEWKQVWKQKNEKIHFVEYEDKCALKNINCKTQTKCSNKITDLEEMK